MTLVANREFLGDFLGEYDEPVLGKGDRTIAVLSEGDYFENCSFVGFSWEQAKETVIKGKTFIDCVFESCFWEKVNFDQSTFFACKFQDCRLKDCAWREVQVERSVFDSCELDGFTFSRASIGSEARSERAGFQQVGFPRTKIKGSWFECIFEEVDFSVSILEGNDFGWAIPCGTIIPPIEIEPIPDMGRRILEVVRDRPEEALEMNIWHSSCGTTHCIAGWSITIHPQGKALEKMLGSYIAGHILFPDASEFFFVENDEAMRFLETFDS